VKYYLPLVSADRGSSCIYILNRNIDLKQTRTVALLSLEELNKLPTQRILAYLSRLQACENSVVESDLEPHEVMVEGITYKESEAWKKQYALVKEVLASRPNIEKSDRG